VIASAGYDNWVALLVAALVLVYLILALIFPERF
jgi:K+-transporting ATPase KdpF subunit